MADELPAKKCKQVNDMSVTDDNYFRSYADITIHQQMIADDVRTSAYRSAILRSYKQIYGKVVLDVGAGTGILSVFCVLAGAKKVYAVEASSMAKQAQLVVASNNMQDKISVIHSKIEDVSLCDQVDVIVSEWMGYMLLYESMLTSVLYARDKFLKPGGIMFPELAKIYIAPVTVSDLYDESVLFWDSVKVKYKVDMSSLKLYAMEHLTHRAHIQLIEGEDVMSRPTEICQLLLTTVNIAQLQHITKACVFECFGDVLIHGFVVWFDVLFPDGSCLSTSPYQPSTHWLQSVIYLHEPLTVKQSDVITADIAVSPNSHNVRFLDINVTCNHSDKLQTINCIMDDFIS